MAADRAPLGSDPVVLLICGSTRRLSTNAALLRALDASPPRGVECVLSDALRRLPHFDPDDDRDPLPGAVADLRASLSAATAVLFCTPEYAGALPGSLKNLLDWTVGGTETQGLPAGWVNVAPAPRGDGAHAELATVAAYTELEVVPAACVRIPVPRDAVGPDGELLDYGALVAAHDAVRALLHRGR